MGSISSKMNYLTKHQEHIRFYEIGGITIQVTADLPITQGVFNKKFIEFQSLNPGQDLIEFHHHFTIPELNYNSYGKKIYHQPPWAVYSNGTTWTYLGIAPVAHDPTLWRLAIFNHNHTHGEIFSPNVSDFIQGDLHSLTLFPTDQIILARVLADRQGCYIHASGMIINGKGLLFVGHSDAGKSTIANILMEEGEILCDDRIIVRRWPDGFKVHGTWSHGEIPIVSNASAPLRAILLLEQASHNRLVPVEDRSEIVRTLPFYVIKPLVTTDWWEKTLDLIGQIAREVPVYRLQFDKSGKVIEVLKQLV
jgi:hypothetical protein